MTVTRWHWPSKKNRFLVEWWERTDTGGQTRRSRCFTKEESAARAQRKTGGKILVPSRDTRGWVERKENS